MSGLPRGAPPGTRPTDGPYVAVWPSRDVVGLDHVTAADDVLWHPVRPLRDALTTSYDTDAHLCALLAFEVPEGGSGEGEGAPGDPPEGAEGFVLPATLLQPRLNSGVLRELKDHGVEVFVTAAFIDVDNPGHKPWATPETGEATLLAFMALWL